MAAEIKLPEQTTWTSTRTFTTCGCETADGKVKRLEKELADAKEEKRKAEKPKTRGEEVAVESVVCVAGDTRINGSYAFVPGILSNDDEDFVPGIRRCVAKLIDAEIANAKQEERAECLGVVEEYRGLSHKWCDNEYYRGAQTWLGFVFDKIKART